MSVDIKCQLDFRAHARTCVCVYVYVSLPMWVYERVCIRECVRVSVSISVEVGNCARAHRLVRVCTSKNRCDYGEAYMCMGVFTEIAMTKCTLA